MKGALPFMGMVVNQVAQVGSTLAAQKAIATGMHTFSFIFYSNALASLILLPAAFLLHRSPNRPALTSSVAGGFLVVGMIGFLAQVVGYAGITYASATVATAILNLIPGFTFVFALILGVERLDYGGSAKLIGTLVTVGGALIVTFYKGPTVIPYRLSSITPKVLDQSSHWILGGLLMLIDSVIAALFVVAQALILKKYSAVFVWILAFCSITAVLSLLASLIFEHDLSAFSLRSKTRLLVILYSGFFGCGFQITIGAWCMKLKGPLFVVMFQPLGIVIAAIIGVLFLGDGLYFGCLLGSVVIAMGFYGVMWGKAKENQIVKANMAEFSNSPLLRDNTEEHNVGALPFVALVVGQVAQVGLTLASQKAIATGMHTFSLIFYSNALTSLILLPAAFLVHRSPNRPALTSSVAGGFLVVGILGFLVQIVGYAGITYASATLATAILNLIPGFTFVFALIFGVERLDYGGSAKIIGTLVTVVGALVVTFYKGPVIITYGLSSIAPQFLDQSSHWILGGVLMLVDSVVAALFVVVQALVLKKYSAVLILMLAYCSIIAVLSLLASLILEHDLSAFSLQSKTRLLVILYSGFFGGGFQITIGAWCMRTKGPLFVVMFQPLGIVIAAIIGVLFLGDGLYLGCLVGSVVIVIGFYGVMWGKAKENKIVKAKMVESSNSPLLEDNTEEHNVVLP